MLQVVHLHVHGGHNTVRRRPVASRVASDPRLPSSFVPSFPGRNATADGDGGTGTGTGTITAWRRCVRWELSTTAAVTLRCCAATQGNGGMISVGGAGRTSGRWGRRGWGAGEGCDAWKGHHKGRLNRRACTNKHANNAVAP